MEVQYIYDEEERKTGVIIPVRLWEKIRDKMEERENEGIFDPSEYRGIYKDQGPGINLEEEIRDLRLEWTRDI